LSISIMKVLKNIYLI